MSGYSPFKEQHRWRGAEKTLSYPNDLILIQSKQHSHQYTCILQSVREDMVRQGQNGRHYPANPNSLLKQTIFLRSPQPSQSVSSLQRSIYPVGHETLSFRKCRSDSILYGENMQFWMVGEWKSIRAYSFLCQ